MKRKNKIESTRPYLEIKKELENIAAELKITPSSLYQAEVDDSSSLREEGEEGIKKTISRAILLDGIKDAVKRYGVDEKAVNLRDLQLKYHIDLDKKGAYKKAIKELTWEKRYAEKMGKKERKYVLKGIEGNPGLIRQFAKIAQTVNKEAWQGWENFVGSFLLLISGIFFLSFNITGNVIGNMTKQNLNIIGALLIICSCFIIFLFSKKKRKNESKHLNR
jgi:hypothetical protein